MVTEAEMLRSRAKFRGVYAIPVTAFHEDGSIDFKGVSKCVEYCIETGSHGIVMPVNASEFFTLSDSERVAVIKAGVDANAGALPLVAGISGVSVQHAIELSLAAQDAGADALMALPPISRNVSPFVMEEYYRGIGEAVELPVFIQNHDPPAGQKVPLDVMVRLLKEVNTISYIKEETMPPGQAITAEFEAAGIALEGVMGGMGGRYLLDEYARGACGTMPGCHMPDVHAALWGALERGDEAESIRIYNKMAPMLLFENAFGAAVYKNVLHRRGVIDSPHMRAPARRHMDSRDSDELDRLLAEVSEFFTWKG